MDLAWEDNPKTFGRYLGHECCDSFSLLFLQLLRDNQKIHFWSMRYWIYLIAWQHLLGLLSRCRCCRFRNEGFFRRSSAILSFERFRLLIYRFLRVKHLWAFAGLCLLILGWFCSYLLFQVHGCSLVFYSGLIVYARISRQYRGILYLIDRTFREAYS